MSSKYQYEEVDTGLGGIVILRSDGANIPSDLNNADYRVYLAEIDGETL